MSSFITYSVLSKMVQSYSLYEENIHNSQNIWSRSLAKNGKNEISPVYTSKASMYLRKV